jgi:HK97 gp10 family phage protein
MAEVYLDVSGIDRLLQEAPQKVDRWARGFVEEMTNNIKLSFGTSPPGRAHPRGQGRVHIASRPGHPPNVDMGTLINSMRWEAAGRLTYHVIAATTYAHYLEFGTERMGARPFIKPEFVRAGQRIGQDARDNLGLE